MYIALTGTPGTGKTSAAEILSERGFFITTVEQLARKQRAIEEVNGDLEVDTELLAEKLGTPEGDVIIEGHLAHLLVKGLCIVLRCHPEILRVRLEARGYPSEKLAGNLEAEAIDLIMSEAVENCAQVSEVDASEMSPGDVADIIERIINGEADKFPPGKVDWSEVVMDWY